VIAAPASQVFNSWCHMLITSRLSLPGRLVDGRAWISPGEQRNS
jgi:hypothetical protein